MNSSEAVPRTNTSYRSDLGTRSFARNSLFGVIFEHREIFESLPLLLNGSAIDWRSTSPTSRKPNPMPKKSTERLNSADVTEPTGRVKRRFVMAVQVAMIGLVLWLGFSTFRSMSTLFGKTKKLTDVQEANVKSNQSSVDEIAATFIPPAGHWTVEGLEWGLGRSEMSAEEVDGRMREIFVSEAAHAEDAAAPLPSITSDWRKLIDQAGQLEPIKQGDNTIYRIEQPALKARIVVRQSGDSEELIAGAIAFPASGDRWELIDLVPNASHGEGDPVPHLLPMPIGAQRSMARWSQDGGLLMELISLNADGRLLMQMWKSAGWSVHPSRMGDPANFSLQCHRGDDSIYAWSDDSMDAISQLMLVHTSPTKNKSDEESHELHD